MGIRTTSPNVMSYYYVILIEAEWVSYNNRVFSAASEICHAHLASMDRSKRHHVIYPTSHGEHMLRFFDATNYTKTNPTLLRDSVEIYISANVCVMQIFLMFL